MSGELGQALHRALIGVNCVKECVCERRGSSFIHAEDPIPSMKFQLNGSIREPTPLKVYPYFSWR